MGGGAAPGAIVDSVLSVWTILSFIGGFILGGVPFGIVVSRLFGLQDPRSIGSGNIGATNVLRTGSKKAAVVTLLLDVLKGVAPAALAGAQLGPLAAAAAGLGAFLGHCYSPYLGFRGGKGVATGFGVILAWSALAGLAAALCWIAAAVVTKRSSLGAFAATAAALASFAVAGQTDFLLALLPMAGVMIWRHRENIRRLLKGEEPPISFASGGAGGDRSPKP
jgi:glycerol-3-phosphate acyltransferase PlsY